MTLLWQPQEDQIAATNLARFQSFINAFDRDCRSFWDLHDFSIHDNERFYLDRLLGLCRYHRRARRDRRREPGEMPGARYFPQGRISYAENLLRPAERADSDDIALIFQAEDRKAEQIEGAR